MAVGKQALLLISDMFARSASDITFSCHTLGHKLLAFSIDPNVCMCVWTDDYHVFASTHINRCLL